MLINPSEDMLSSVVLVPLLDVLIQAQGTPYFQSKVLRALHSNVLCALPLRYTVLNPNPNPNPNPSPNPNPNPNPNPYPNPNLKLTLFKVPEQKPQ